MKNRYLISMFLFCISFYFCYKPFMSLIILPFQSLSDLVNKKTGYNGKTFVISEGFELQTFS